MYSTGIGLLIKGIEKVENELQREKTSSKPMEVIIESASRKNRGLFASLLEGTKKFIKDDISDQDFLK